MPALAKLGAGLGASDRRLARLVDRARRGDGQAFRRLYRLLAPPIEAYVDRRVREPADAEDLVARTFEKILARLDQFDPSRGSVRMWAFGIARNLVIDHHRAAGRSASTDPILLDHGPAEGEDPLSRLLRDEQNARLLDLLGALPPDRRELLALRYGEGLSTRDIAQLLDLGEAAVRQRLSRTRRELERQLAALTAAEGAADYAS